MTDESQRSVLLTTFTSRKKRYKVFFHQDNIIWDNERPPSGTFQIGIGQFFTKFNITAQSTVPIENVISVQHNVLQPRHPLDDTETDPNSFVIHYASRGSQKVLHYKSIIFRHNDHLQVSSWVKTLQNRLQSKSNEPHPCHYLKIIFRHQLSRRDLKSY